MATRKRGDVGGSDIGFTIICIILIAILLLANLYADKHRSSDVHKNERSCQC